MAQRALGLAVSRIERAPLGPQPVSGLTCLAAGSGIDAWRGAGPRAHFCERYISFRLCGRSHRSIPGLGHAERRFGIDAMTMRVAHGAPLRSVVRRFDPMWAVPEYRATIPIARWGHPEWAAVHPDEDRDAELVAVSTRHFEPMASRSVGGSTPAVQVRLWSDLCLHTAEENVFNHRIGRIATSGANYSSTSMTSPVALSTERCSECSAVAAGLPRKDERIISPVQKGRLARWS